MFPTGDNMKRRNFVKDTGIVVLGIGVFGSIRWSDDRFIGNNATTTDILGPFYRPAAPVRININPPEFTGELFHLSGKICKPREWPQSRRHPQTPNPA